MKFSLKNEYLEKYFKIQRIEFQISSELYSVFVEIIYSPMSTTLPIDLGVSTQRDNRWIHFDRLNENVDFLLRRLINCHQIDRQQCVLHALSHLQCRAVRTIAEHEEKDRAVHRVYDEADFFERKLKAMVNNFRYCSVQRNCDIDEPVNIGLMS